jgi:hypothetical protein
MIVTMPPLPLCGLSMTVVIPPDTGSGAGCEGLNGGG